MNSGQLSREVIQTKAKTIGSKLYSYPTPPSLSVVIAAASLSKHGYLTRVEAMKLSNINLASVPHAACLGDIQVDYKVWIDNVQGDIGSIVAKVKCSGLSIHNMQLSVGATQALVAGMAAGVERGLLGGSGSVEVDMETLASYDGQGQCTRLTFWWQTHKRYRAEVKSWAEKVGWIELGNPAHIEVRRKDDTSADGDE